jgi:gas vesicle protein
MEGELSQSNVKISNLQSENTDLRSRVTQAQADAQSAMNQLSGYQATVQTQAKHAGADIGSRVGAKVAETASDVKDKVSEKISSDDDNKADPNHRQPGTVGPGQGTA